jgi:hypothetical protein
MILLILGIVFIIYGVVLIISGEEDLFNKLFMFIVGIGFFVWFFLLRCSWYKDYEELKIYNILIENKIHAIKTMKQTYYNPPKNIQFNLDMVNKELTKQINEKISELTTTINDYNKNIKQWNVKYRYRFFNNCPIKLEENKFKIIKLSDYNLELNKK